MPSAAPVWVVLMLAACAAAQVDLSTNQRNLLAPASPKKSPPKPKSPSPKKRSPSPRKRSPSPSKRSPSPRKRSPSPSKRSPSPRKRSPSPKPKSPSARPKSPSPKPKSPPKGGTSPARTVRVLVGGGDTGFEFVPKVTKIRPNDKVTFVVETLGHNVFFTKCPSGVSCNSVTGPMALWQQTGDFGTSHTVTFRVAGIYEYICSPHAAAGMVGTINVNANN